MGSGLYMVTQKNIAKAQTETPGSLLLVPLVTVIPLHSSLDITGHHTSSVFSVFYLPIFSKQDQEANTRLHLSYDPSNFSKPEIPVAAQNHHELGHTCGNWEHQLQKVTCSDLTHLPLLQVSVSAAHVDTAKLKP